MLTEEILVSYEFDELVQLLAVKLEKFEEIQQNNADHKTIEVARIELDLIEYVIDERSAKLKP